MNNILIREVIFQTLYSNVFLKNTYFKALNRNKFIVYYWKKNNYIQDKNENISENKSEKICQIIINKRFTE